MRGLRRYGILPLKYLAVLITVLRERRQVARLIPNEEPEQLPEELYDELEAQESLDAEDEINYLLENTNLTVEEAERFVAEQRDEWSPQ